MPAFDIRPLTDEAALRAAWPVAAQLRPQFDEDAFVAQVLRQFGEGYHAAALYDPAGVPRAFAGWRRAILGCRGTPRPSRAWWPPMR